MHSERRGGLPSAALVASQVVAEALGVLLAPLRLGIWALFGKEAERRRALAALQAPVPDLAAPAAAPAAPRAGPPLTLFVSAGEASGDLHAGHLIRELRARRADLRVIAFGGENMRAAGAEILLPLARRAGMGLLHGLRSIPSHTAIARRFVDVLDAERPAACVLVDNPGFHLILASLARRRSVAAVQYVCPQIWAWAPWRWRRMRRDVARALAIVPFEVPYFGSRGIDAAWVGHPLGDDLVDRAADPEEVRRLAAGGPLVVLFPGSRRSEVERNLRPFLRIAARLRDALPDLRFVLSLRDEERAAQARAILAAETLPFEVALHHGAPDALLGAAALALAKSGTGTLEIAHHRVPLVIHYELARRFDRWLSRAVLTLPHISMLNLLARRAVVPEVLGSSPADEERSATAALTLLRDPQARRAQREALEPVMALIERPGAAARSAEIVLDLVDGPRAPRAR